MDQNRIDQAEWENRRNWTGPRWASVYCSRIDSRTVVPKQVPWRGWTLNLGKTSGVFWLIAAIAGIPLLVILVSTMTNTGG